MLSKILIIDSRKELPAKYKKSLENDEISCDIINNLRDSLVYIENNEPDLILISDSIQEKLSSFCQRIRNLTYNTRPVIVGISKSADINDRIEVLESGADDFLSEPVNIDEFKTRIKAHVRREVESSLDSNTLLPNAKYIEKVIKRVIHLNTKPASLLVSVENLNNYKSVYSELAGNKLLQTFIAITKSALSKDDFLGQLDETSFLIFTNPYSAEKIAEFLTFAFDTVVTKFYSEADSKRGYTLLDGDREAGMGADFVTILAGGIIDNYEMINSPNQLIQRLRELKKMAKLPSGSNYVFDRIKLSGEYSEQKVNNTIYVNEPDESLALLLRTTLELQGYDVSENIDINQESQPSVIILDSRDDMSGLELCKQLKSMRNFVNTKIIVTTTVHDKVKILDSGADLYLPKPYEMSDLIRWVEYFKK